MLLPFRRPVVHVAGVSSPRSPSNIATVFERIDGPPSARIVSCPGSIPWRSQLVAISVPASRADSRWASCLGSEINWNLRGLTCVRPRKDRGFPGITDCSLDTAYSYNQAIEWSCPWHDFAGDIVDTPDHYEMVLRVVHDAAYPESGTIDITPRRLQALAVEPGWSYTWGRLVLVLVDGELAAGVGRRGLGDGGGAAGAGRQSGPQ